MSPSTSPTERRSCTRRCRPTRQASRSAAQDPGGQSAGVLPCPARATTQGTSPTYNLADVPHPSRPTQLLLPRAQRGGNLEGLVNEALDTLPTLADTFEIIAVDDGSKDGTPAIADALAAAHPDVVRAVHHPTNLGYGAALRSGFAAARYDLVAFTDGDRQFKVADIGRLTARLAEPDRPDVVVGFRIKRADPLVRTALRPRVPPGQPHLLRPQGHRRRLRLQALPTRGARRAPRRVRRRLLLRRDDHQAPRRRSDRRRGRRPALPADRRLGDAAPSPRSSSAPSATSGSSACGCGPTARAPFGAANRSRGRRRRLWVPPRRSGIMSLALIPDPKRKTR